VDALLGATARTRLRRLPEKATTERRALYDVLDAGLVAHVGLVDGHHPFVVPCGYARDRDRILLHGSTGSRMMRSLAAGRAACVTVTILDGLVYAKSLFNSSMNYRSAMVLGRAGAVAEEDKEAALHVIADHLMPGRWADARPALPRELAGTLIVAMTLDEASVKISDGPPDDDAEDADWPAWSGVLPLALQPGRPQSADGHTVPDYVEARWR